MKINKILAASVIAGAVMLSSTACTPSTDNQGKPNSPSASTSATPLPSDSVGDAATVVQGSKADTEQVIATVNGFYNFIIAADSNEKVQKAGDRFAGKAEASDAELQAMVTDFPEGFQYFDTSTSQNIKNAYIHLLGASNAAKATPGIQVRIPTEAITIVGNTAKVDSTKTVVTSTDATVTNPADPFSGDHMNLVKTKDGAWVIVAEAPITK